MPGRGSGDPIGFERAGPTARQIVARCVNQLDEPHIVNYLDDMMSATDAAAHATSDDPAVGLRAVASLRALAEATEELHVRRARELGWSWQQIAVCLNVSKQGLHQKYGKERISGRRNLP
jgi:hypothetical protein